MPTSFPPVVDAGTRVLVLGSMPGEASLRARQYYAHPRNAFWRIIGELVGFDPGADYPQRISCLRRAGIGIWDVLYSCERVGSMDAAISGNALKPNDFRTMLDDHPGISHVFFNGAKAEHLFLRLVRPALGELHALYQRLPSTSPANASIPYPAKLAAWRAIVDVGLAR